MLRHPPNFLRMRATTSRIQAEAAKGKRLNSNKRKELEDRVLEIEENIGRGEASIAQCEAALQNFVSADENQRQSQELEEHKASHAALIVEWEGLAETLQAD